MKRLVKHHWLAAELAWIFFRGVCVCMRACVHQIPSRSQWSSAMFRQFVHALAHDYFSLLFSHKYFINGICIKVNSVWAPSNAAMHTKNHDTPNICMFIIILCCWLFSHHPIYSRSRPTADADVYVYLQSFSHNLFTRRRLLLLRLQLFFLLLIIIS